ncbi:MAG: N-acetyltransferase [Acidimicrobiia bacterium]
MFVPADFEVPRSFEGPGFRLEPLGSEHNKGDHEAWMSSIEHIESTPGMDLWRGHWPVPMSLDDNLADLIRHRDEFDAREAFAYSVLDRDEVIGCVYINPIDGKPREARVLSWVRASKAEMDRVVWASVSEWLATDWPFRNVTYALRL